jgi:hypothetical protein
VRPYDNAPAAEFWPNYVRGLAYLGLKDGPKAALEFQRITTHRGEAPASMLFALATLGTAQAATLMGDRDRARGAYENFLALWRDAEPHLLPIAAAHQGLAALRQ